MMFSIEQADSVVESLGMTELVEEYELNENGHVYTLFDGSALVVVSAAEHYFA